MNKRILPLVCFVSLLILSGCTKKQSTEPDPGPDPIAIAFSMAHSPDLASAGTKFNFTVQGLTAADDTSEYQMQIDWNNDGTYDTDWLPLADMTHAFTNIGKNIINVLIKNLEDAEVSFKDSVVICELIQLTQNESGNSHYNIDMSPDGSNRIAFSMNPEGDTKRKIFVVEYPGGTPEQVTFNKSATVGSFNDYPEWSLDGEQIVFYNSDSDNPYESEMKVITLDDGTIVSIPSDHDPSAAAWSPDNKGILFFGPEIPGFSAGWNLYYHSFTTGNDSLILEDGSHAFCWSPSGDIIAYSKHYGLNNSEVGTIIRFTDFQTGNEIKQYNINGGRDFDWSPDGKWIALGFTNNNDQTGLDHVLHILNYNSGKIYTFKADELYREDGSSWSADNSLLAFSAQNFESQYLHLSIWAIRFPDDLE